MFLLQMAGFPGSGKSTLAKEISRHIDVVVIDRDIIKSSMMESGVGLDIVNNASYSVVFSLSKYYLNINKNVIIDTPCFYEGTLENGIEIAKTFGAEYKYVECRLEDFDEVGNRLKTRESSVSQIKSAERERFLVAIDKSKKPINYECLTIDTSLPVEAYINEVLIYLSR
jgi:predicted kinase